MPVAQLAYLKLRKSLKDHSQRATAHLIEPQIFFLWLVVKAQLI